MNKLVLPVFALLSLTLLSRCAESCNDCLELTAKSVVYLDPEGNNLLFGDSAVLDPDSIRIQIGNNAPDVAWQDAGDGAIRFFLSENDNEYTIFLPNGSTDVLRFGLCQVESEDCCGTKPVSSSTELNASEIENTDRIEIVRDF